jgi:hypothetical protein
METEIDLTPYRWWTFAPTEEQARSLIRRTRERNAALGLHRDHGLGASAVIPVSQRTVDGAAEATMKTTRTAKPSTASLDALLTAWLDSVIGTREEERVAREAYHAALYQR